MIHSMAGGKLGRETYNDFAKVKICEGINSGDIFWYICTGQNVQAGSTVVVPVGASNTLVKGQVERVDRNISSYASPVAVRRAKSIAKIITD